MSTIVWVMLVLSSILSHYASSYRYRLEIPFSFVRLAKVLANVLRWGGKLLAIINAIGVIASGMLQFTSVYDNCYCNSSVLGLGIDRAYSVISPSDSQVDYTLYAWCGALALGSCTSLIYIFYMNLLTDLLPT
jgi:ABC-type multidrug transport system permease subunit